MIEIVSMLIAGTCNISESDNDKLTTKTDLVPLAYDKIEYGYLFWVPDDDGIREDLEGQLKKAGYSPGLHALLEKANELGCRYLYLDRDAEPVEGLPTFDW